MTPIPPIVLEIIVIALGLLMLLAESFSKSEDKRGLAITAIFTLLWVFGFSFFTTGNPPAEAATGYWQF